MYTRMINILADQRVGFLLVGATNTVVGFAVFSVLTLTIFRDVQVGYLFSLGISYAIGISLGFVLYRRFVFKVRGHLIRDFGRFTSVYVVAIAINAALLPLLVEVVSVPPLLAQTIILMVTTLISFFGHKSFSFRRTPRDLPPDGTAAS